MKNYLVTIGAAWCQARAEPPIPRSSRSLLRRGCRADTVRPQLQQEMAELEESAGENPRRAPCNNQSERHRPDGHCLGREHPQACKTGAKRMSSASWFTISGISIVTETSLEEQRKLLSRDPRLSTRKKARIARFHPGVMLVGLISSAAAWHSAWPLVTLVRCVQR